MVEQKKKKWYEIISSNHFRNIIIGEIPTSEEKNLIGKFVNVNFASLTNDMKKQHVNITFLINEVKENKAFTELVGYNILNSYVKRITKRSKSKIEDSFLCITKDNIKVRVKPLILLKNKTIGSVLKVLKKDNKEMLLDFFKKNDYDTTISFILDYKLQKDLKNRLKKKHPIGLVEIRIFKKIK